MELRQLHYFVALAEELHFGRAAVRMRIGQSALSQQLQKLEHELGARLLDRDTQRAELTDAGKALLSEARLILAHVERTKKTVKRTTEAVSTLYVGVSDPSYDSMTSILRRVRHDYPEMAIHQYEASLPEQIAMLMAGHLDVAFGRMTTPHAELTAELIRYARLGMLIKASHKLAALPSVPLAAIADVPLLLVHENRAPEYNDFLQKMYYSAKVIPRYYNGSIASLIAAHEVLMNQDCWMCVPASCARWLSGVIWIPLTRPIVRYPLSLVWRSDDDSPQVRAIVSAARAVSAEHDWVSRVSDIYAP